MGEWKEDARRFFGARAAAVSGNATAYDLSLISGRDPRLWDDSLYNSLVDSVVTLAEVGPDTRLLEVGCAAGFLARGLAPRTRSYVGVDIAEPALNVARRLDLENASFVVADGSALPFEDTSFDAVVCYDVVSNVPDFTEVEAMVSEMLRVVRPRGRVLVGSVPDRAAEAEAVERFAEVSSGLESQFGAIRDLAASDGSITNYYYARDEFRELGARLGALVEIHPVHADNPYVNCRFNSVFTPH